MIPWPQNGAVVDVHFASGEVLLEKRIVVVDYAENAAVLDGEQHRFFVDLKHVAYFTVSKPKEETK